MAVKDIENEDIAQFKRLFCDYYRELDCDDDPAAAFDCCVAPDLEAGLLSAAIAREKDGACGFVIWQIDDMINDWCFYEGKADIREIYVSPSARRRGLGKSLLAYAEKRLAEAGADDVYLLPTDDSEKFFVRCGYADIGDYCAELDSKVFGKKL